MRHAAAVFGTAALLTVGLFAQTPSFAGKWTLVPDPNAAGGFAGLGDSVAIVQDAATLTMTRSTQMGELKMTYKLDGSESKNSLNIGGNSVDQVSKAKWDGGKLTINTSMNFAGTAVDIVTVLSLDASGNLLVVRTAPDFQGGGQPVTTKSSYKKS